MTEMKSPALFLNPVIKQLVEHAKGGAVTVDFTSTTCARPRWPQC